MTAGAVKLGKVGLGRVSGRPSENRPNETREDWKETREAWRYCGLLTQFNEEREDDEEVLLYVHRNRRLIRDGSPGRPPRLSHSS